MSAKIRVYSDLHLDWYAHAFNKENNVDPFWYPPELPDDKDTILILAGDVWIGTRFIEWCGFSWIGEMSKQFKQVLVVLGNHDYWPCNQDLTIKAGADKCNAMLSDMKLDNVKVLDCNTFEMDDVLFIGATLWTDMNKEEPLTMYNMSLFMRYDGKISFEIGNNHQWDRFTSQRWVREHYRHRDYIKLVSEQNRDKKIVVITHHMPLIFLGDPIYLGNSSNSYYSSDLSDIVLDNPHIAMWCFGHSHYTVREKFGNTIMVNNSVGYQGEHKEQAGYVSHEVIEI